MIKQINFPRVALVMSALLLGAGLAGSGFFVGEGISGRGSERHTISVRGLSEKEVPASIATWYLCYDAVGNDTDELNAKLAESRKTVLAFLAGTGFDAKELAVQPPVLTDTLMESREKDAPPLPPERYSVTQSVVVRTANVDLIKQARASSSTLLASGVHLSFASKPDYIFNQLNEIKPGMIQEATRNARTAAEQFARDSQTTLGKLRNATQGLFVVENRDEATPERKIVRVIVEVEYEVK